MMASKAVAALVLALLGLTGGCAKDTSLDSDREWQRAECNHIIDREARQRCLKRVDSDSGGRDSEPEAPRGKR